MSADGLKLPSNVQLRQHVLFALAAYWKTNENLISGLPVHQAELFEVSGPLKMHAVILPEWASSSGVDGCLLVPAEACAFGTGWESVDWWLAAFLLLECWHERAWEESHGPIHSYSFRLAGWDTRVWERAWVNRIAIFLRQWAARACRRNSDELFGCLPAPKIIMTHDVDAVQKTLAIRIKQGVFHLFNVARLASRGQWSDAGSRFNHAIRFLFGNDEWWCYTDIQNIEKRAGLRSIFHFAADPRRKNLTRWLLDPGYDVRQARIQTLIAGLVQDGWRIGLHQSFDAWNDCDLMSAQRSLLQTVSPQAIHACRQHWLKFSWKKTWTAQCASGLNLDTTLMFNDRMGFRGAAALSWSPWDPVAGQRHGLHAMPTVLMDSHVYDYLPMTEEQRLSAFRFWLDEIRAVGGCAAVLWHPQTISNDYGWRQGFIDLVNLMKDEKCDSL